MTPDAEMRPSPEALLTQATREGRGRLKIFLGAAPGVGKTWAMLDDAHRKYAEGVDVVAALIDGESTLKTFLLERGKPCLRAENPKFPKLLPAHELVVQGVMVALIRRCP